MTVGEYYDATVSLWETEGFDNARALAAMVAGYGGGTYFLDVGCGVGNMFPYLLKGANSEIVGLDVSPVMLQTARERYAHEPRIFLQEGPFERLASGGFDSIVAFNVYHHFLAPERFLRRACRLLAEDGRLTAAYGYGRVHLNNISKLLPSGIARELSPLSEEVALWSKYFRMDCYLDSDDFLILSGVKRSPSVRERIDPL